MRDKTKTKKFDKDKFNKIATYNSEVCRGLLHTKKYSTEMRLIQIEYDKYIRECL